jgi:hypothetical protein
MKQFAISFLLVFFNLHAGSEEPIQQVYFRTGGGRAHKYIVLKDHSVYQLKELELRCRYFSEWIWGKKLELPLSLSDSWENWTPGSSIQIFSQDKITKADRENIHDPNSLIEYPIALFNISRGTYFFAQKKIIEDPLVDFPAFAFQLGYFNSFNGTNYDIPELQSFFWEEWDPQEYPQNFKKLFYKCYKNGMEHGRQTLDQINKFQQSSQMLKMTDEVARLRKEYENKNSQDEWNRFLDKLNKPKPSGN